MTYQFGWNSWTMVVASVAALALAGTLWRRRSAPGAVYLILLELGVAVWSLGYAFETAATAIPIKAAWLRFAHIGVAASSPCYFLFALAYSHHERQLKRHHVLLLWIVPVLTMILALSNEWHHWIWTGVRIDPESGMGIYGHGWYFWAFAVYGYVVVAGAFFLLINTAVRVSRPYKRQLTLLLVAGALPALSDIVSIISPELYRFNDFTPVAFMVAGAILAWAMSRYQVLDLMPIVRDRVVDTMRDSIILVDAGGRVGDMNPAMEALAGVSASLAVGRPLAEVASRLPSLVELLEQGADLPAEFHIAEPADNRYFDLQRSPLLDHQENVVAEIYVLRDITARKRLEEERAKLLQELQEALTQVKTLSGLLPICANCKRIRDDQGYWHNLEAYLAHHSDTEFTHGICPECMKKLYPDFPPK